MKSYFFKRRPKDAAGERLYGEIMAAARQPALYLDDYAAPDTLDGRFDLVVLHAFLVIRRLSALPEPAPQMAQALSNLIFAGFDAALREMGVGDTSVPKRMTKFAESYGGRTLAYEAALAQPWRPQECGEDALQSALARNVYGSANPSAAARLTRYARIAAARLQETDFSVFARGVAPFPDPAQVK